MSSMTFDFFRRSFYMELVKKNIQHEQTKAKAVLQLPMEEDMNVPDSKPDVGQILYSRGRIKIEEIKPGMNKVWVKGRLRYQILYLEDGVSNSVASIEGECSFMEEIYMESVESQDRIVCEADLEDMRVNIINSRKLSIQALLTLRAHALHTKEEAVCVQLAETISPSEQQKDKLEYRKKDFSYMETIASKRDLLRIHEEAKLPSGVDSIAEVIWKSADVRNVQFRLLDGKIGVSGDIILFVMYKGGRDDKNNWHETKISFSGFLDCVECQEDMLSDISFEIAHEDISIREDQDGEARIITIDLTMELELKLWNPESIQIVSDLYGVTCEVDCLTNSREYERLFHEVKIEEKMNYMLEPHGEDAKILQICHYDTQVTMDNAQLREDEIYLSGTITHRVLYLKNSDEMSYGCMEEIQPFEIIRPLSGVNAQMQYIIHPQIQQTQVSLREGNQVECRLVLSIFMPIFMKYKEEMLCEMKIERISDEKLESLPGITIYFVKPGDTLWQIGRKYYVSVDELKEVNQLTSDEIYPGDKLLIVKSGS